MDIDASLRNLTNTVRNAEARLKLLQLQGGALVGDIDKLRQVNRVMIEANEETLAEYNRIQHMLRVVQLQRLMGLEKVKAWAKQNQVEFQRRMDDFNAKVETLDPLQNEFGVDLWQQAKQMLRVIPRDIAVAWLDNFDALFQDDTWNKKDKVSPYRIWVEVLLTLDSLCRVGKRVQSREFQEALMTLLGFIDFDNQKDMVRQVTETMDTYPVCGNYWYTKLVNFANDARNASPGIERQRIMVDFMDFVINFVLLLEMN